MNRLHCRPAIGLLVCAVLCVTLTNADKLQDMIQELKPDTAYDMADISPPVLDTIRSCMSFVKYFSQDEESKMINKESPLATLCASILLEHPETSEDYDPNTIKDKEKLDMLMQKFLIVDLKRPDAKVSDDVKRQVGQSRVLHFGKRGIALGVDKQNAFRQLDNVTKRNGQNYMLHFGKQGSNGFIGSGKRATNRFLHFGKRDFEPSEIDKRSSKFMHFGKRDYEKTDAVINYDTNFEDELIKRGSPSSRFIHFGKRDGQGRSTLLSSKNASFQELYPVSQKRFSITYASLPFQQALLRHRLNIMGKNQALRSAQSYSGEDQNHSAAFHRSQVFLDRISRSDQFQIPQVRAQSRWTRPDRNVFLHFG